MKYFNKNVESSAAATDSETGEQMEDALKICRKFAENDFSKCSEFVIGSSAVGKGSWITAKQIIREKRSRFKPLVFEEIMFLKQNSHFLVDLIFSEDIRCPLSARFQYI